MIRLAERKDLDAIYRMGYDAWGDAKPLAEYLEECAASKKYSSGTWYVLEEAERVLSSLIVYRLTETAFGIGSIATRSDVRRRGRAAELIAGVLKILDDQTSEAVYLHSEIGAVYYERFGFRALPTALQRRSASVCMIRCSPERFASLIAAPQFRAPDYF
jgi:predicted acetyltransferase